MLVEIEISYSPKKVLLKHQEDVLILKKTVYLTLQIYLKIYVEG